MYDIAIIGAGPAGYEGALHAAQLGMKVALIEKGAVGGTCLHRGCIPTKALMHASELFHGAAGGEMAAWGIHAGTVSFDTDTVYARKNAIVEQLCEGIESALASAKVDIFRGTARIEQQCLVSVADAHGKKETVEARNLLIAVGAKPIRLPLPGAELPCVITSDDLLRDPCLYDELCIVGGGVIGVEIASMYASFGRKVLLVEAASRLLPTMERELSQSLTMALKQRGVQVVCGATVEGFAQNGNAVVCHISKGEAKDALQADAVLVAVGRRPALEGLFADEMQPVMAGPILQVDDRFATSIEGIYAVGDAASAVQLAHLATAQAICAVDGMAGVAPSRRLDLIPSCLYTSPEAACVGLTQTEAASRRIEVRVYKQPVTGLGRVQIEGGPRSYVKLIADAAHGKLLGVELFCPRATDMIFGLALAIEARQTFEEVTGVVFPHPTVSEGIAGAALLGAVAMAAK